MIHAPRETRKDGYNLVMHVILFDIDGTLISTARAGGDALLDTVREDFGIAEIRQDVSMAGRTDRAIARDLLTYHGLPATDEHWLRLRAGYLRRLPQYLAARRGKVLAGVRALLDRLAVRGDAALGLLTGNVRAGAELKLGHYGLWADFAFGGFGDEHEDRDHVAAAALAAARAHLGPGRAPRSLWVIGDTPLDVRCARSIGARAIAVATGGHSLAELEASRADWVVESLEDTAWLEALD